MFGKFDQEDQLHELVNQLLKQNRTPSRLNVGKHCCEMSAIGDRLQDKPKNIYFYPHSKPLSSK